MSTVLTIGLIITQAQGFDPEQDKPDSTSRVSDGADGPLSALFSSGEWLYLVTGHGTAHAHEDEHTHTRSAEHESSKDSWLPVPALEAAHILCGCCISMTGLSYSLKVKDRVAWETLYNSSEQFFTADLPGNWGHCTPLQRLCLVRCLKPDQVIKCGEETILFRIIYVFCA